uniref:Uncharacterized protein n=1 Tax=Eptatretus burgeri TaxID=7764 RepID=A0A8C4NHA8_EPTBU
MPAIARHFLVKDTVGSFFTRKFCAGGRSAHHACTTPKQHFTRGTKWLRISTRLLATRHSARSLPAFIRLSTMARPRTCTSVLGCSARRCTMSNHCVVCKEK